MDISLLNSTNRVYIVGAQSRAKTLTGYLHFLFPDIIIEAYLVNDLLQNDSFVQGVPVKKLCKNSFLNLELPVFIATKGIYHDDIEKELNYMGFYNIIPVTVAVDNWFRNEYVRKFFQMENLLFKKIDEMEAESQYNKQDTNINACIYMAKSIYDKPLHKYEKPVYERAIQVGAALTDKRLEPGIMIDCVGENISIKNRQYCELTALYWIWKNALEDYVGLSHYRRHFILPNGWQDIVISNKIDVILPVPTYVWPSIDENYKERHDPYDWNYLLEYLQKKSVEDYNIASKVFSQNLYVPCNMFIMRKEIVNELCTWMFPILDAIVEHGGEKADPYFNRYPGFISERLLTLFFSKYKDKYKIVYADKNFIL